MDERRSHSQSLSLSQELSSARLFHRSTGSPMLRHQRSESLLGSHYSKRPEVVISTPEPDFSVLAHHERTVTSLKSEVLRLQDVIQERENEIASLEKALYNSRSVGSTLVPSESDEAYKTTVDEDPSVATQHSSPYNAGASSDTITSDEVSPIGRMDELMRWA
jgi:hypothetical protein